MPFLQLLWIDDNFIRSIAQLSKAWLPELATLYISSTLEYIGNNPIKDCQQLTKFKAKLGKLFLEYGQDPELATDLGWIFKLEAQQLKILQI